MLSRHAQSLYWIGRYLERAGHLCRLLRLQSDALVDRPVREIHFGWNRIYTCLDQEPPGGSIEVFAEEDFALADSFALADDLTFERSNPCSVYACFAQGRENARDTRHCISPEVWTSLNTSYQKAAAAGHGHSVWQRRALTAFYDRYRAPTSTTFRGLAETTMYHDEGLEFPPARPPRRARPVRLAALLLSQIDASAALRPMASSTRRTGCPSCASYHALEVVPAPPQAPRSSSGPRPRPAGKRSRCCPTPSARSINLITCRDRRHRTRVRAATPAAPSSVSPDRLASMINNEWPDQRRTHIGLLREVIRISAANSTSSLTAAYFEYPVQEQPPTWLRNR